MSNALVVVMSTPELLELTLSHLPMRDLLVIAPLVSKTWQALTLTPALQRALFFQPDPSSPRVQNPLLVELFPPFFAVPESSNRWTWPNAESIGLMPWAKAPAAFKRPEASWRRMLAMQPPAVKMLATERCHARRGDFECRAVLELGDDVCLRMGLLYDLVLPFIDRASSSFCIRWPSAGEQFSLAVIYTQQCCRGQEPKIGQRFYSDAIRGVDIQFGKQSSVPRR